jgi:hypothetical protein
MPLINPTVGAISQFTAPFDLISGIELSWKSPINSAINQFVAPFDLTSTIESAWTNPTTGAVSQFTAPFDLTSIIETTWVNPISNKLTAVKPDANPQTYDPTTFVAGNTYPTPSDLQLAPKNNVKVLVPDTDSFTFNPITKPDANPETYDPTTFTVTSSYSADLKELTLNPKDDTFVRINDTDKFAFNPIKAPDTGSFTYDPSKFETGKTYPGPKELTYNGSLNTASIDDFTYTYQPAAFAVTSSYSADPKELTLDPSKILSDPNADLKVNTSTTTTNSTFTPKSSPDDSQYTHNPTTFIVGNTYSDPKLTLKNNTNNDVNLAQIGIGAAGNAVGSLMGTPQAAQAAQAALLSNYGSLSSKYATLSYDQLTRKDATSVFVLYPDFRAKRTFAGGAAAFLKVRADGAAAAFRGSKLAIAYAASSAVIGAYSVFNIDGGGQTGYGIGEPGTPFKLRNDFTMRSHIARNFNDTTKKYEETGNWAEKAIAFNGDRVNVIDYKRSQEIKPDKRLRDIYKWKNDGDTEFSYTRDFIKFFFTGPKITDLGGTDDVIVFRAIINSVSDRFSPQWTDQRFVGRPDPNYVYTQYSRDLDLDFTIYATDRDEVQPIWRKLNALASYTTPDYDPNSLGPIGPWMRFTLGDLFQQTPCFISSLSYTLHDSETTWEINIEDDPYMKQTPHKIGVSMGLTIVTDTVPQKNGIFYGLRGNKSKFDWLKDAEGYVEQTTADGLDKLETALNNVKDELK